MKHAQKVVLVPYDQVMMSEESMPPHNINQLNGPPNPVLPSTPLPRDILKDRLSDLDSKMKAIVQDDTLSQEEKVIRYNNILEQYLLFADKFHDREREREEGTSPQYKDEYHDETERYHPTPSDKHIITSLPPSYQQSGHLLLKYLRDGGTRWNEDGTVIHNGHEIQGTNIKDLVHYVLRHRRRKTAEPNGLSHFQRILKESNLPKHLVPWNKVFDREKQQSVHDEIQEQHGTGKIRRWIKY